MLNPTLYIFHTTNPDSFPRYSMEEHPQYRDGDLVWVAQIFPDRLLRVKIRGLAAHHIVDQWIVDAGAPVSDVYPYSCFNVFHTQILRHSPAPEKEHNDGIVVLAHNNMYRVEQCGRLIAEISSNGDVQWVDTYMRNGTRLDGTTEGCRELCGRAGITWIQDLDEGF